MEAFAILGMGLGIMGMGLGAMAIQRLDKLEKQLKESGVLSNDPK